MAAWALLRLSRIPAVGFTATVGIWGYLAGAHGAGADLAGALESWSVVLLVAIGTFAHIFGCVYNEVCDREIDAHVTYGTAKPLVTGEVSLEKAVRLAGAAAVAGLALSASLAVMTSWTVIPLMGTSLALAAAYNRFGKRFVGGEILYGGSLVAFATAGASAAAGPAALSSPSVLLLALMGAVLLSLNVVYAGGLKDLESDEAAGVRTVLGRLRRAGARRGNPLGLIAALQGVPHVAVLAFAAYGVIFVYDRDPTGLAFRLIALVALTGGRILLFARAIVAPTRRIRLRLLAAHEFLAVALLPFLFADALPLSYGFLLLLVPLALYVGFNRLLYSTLAAPHV